MSGLDALLVINSLLSGNVTPAASTASPGSATPAAATPNYYLDVNGDGHVSAIDALMVINYLLNPTSSAATPSVMTPSAIASTAAVATPTGSASVITPSVAASGVTAGVVSSPSTDAVRIRRRPGDRPTRADFATSDNHRAGQHVDRDHDQLRACRATSSHGRRHGSAAIRPLPALVLRVECEDFFATEESGLSWRFGNTTSELVRSPDSGVE